MSPAVHTLGVLFFHSRGPFRMRIANRQVWLRLFFTFAAPVAMGAWHIVFRVQNLIQIAGVLSTVYLSGGRERHLRARHAELVAAATAASAAGRAKQKDM